VWPMFKEKQKNYILLRPIIDEIMKKNIPIEYTTSQNTTCFLYASVLYIKFTSFLNMNVKDKCTELLGERGRNEILEEEFPNIGNHIAKYQVREYCTLLKLRSLNSEHIIGCRKTKLSMERNMFLVCGPGKYICISVVSALLGIFRRLSGGFRRISGGFRRFSRAFRRFLL
jgi:hypothetical protein